MPLIIWLWNTIPGSHVVTLKFVEKFISLIMSSRQNDFGTLFNVSF